MKSLRPALRQAIAVCFALATWSVQADERDAVAVNAKVFNGYTRTKLADGSFKPERYAFGEGGRWDVGRADKSIDALSFRKIAETIAVPLHAQGYVPAPDAKQTDLMVLVFWGATSGAGGSATAASVGGVTGLTNIQAVAELENRAMNEMFHAQDDPTRSTKTDDGLLSTVLAENSLRDQNNAANARLLGYTEDYQRALELRATGRVSSQDVVQELEAGRYFVVLKAYDFQSALREKKLKLLWEARFSIYERGNKFNEQLLAMTRSAARYFGQDTDGLVRRDLPQGKIDVGTPIVVEPATGANPGAKR